MSTKINLNVNDAGLYYQAPTKEKDKEDGNEVIHKCAIAFLLSKVQQPLPQINLKFSLISAISLGSREQFKQWGYENTLLQSSLQDFEEDLNAVMASPKDLIKRYSKKFTKLDITFNIAKTMNQKCVDVHVYPLSVKPFGLLGMGTHVKVKNLFSLKIDFNESVIKITHEVNTLHRFNKRIKISHAFDKIRKHRKIYELLGKDCTKISLPPLLQLQYKSKFNVEERVEYLQKKYIGGDLFQAIYQKQISERSCLKALIEAADALKSLHRIGYVHGDFKGTNLLLENAGSGAVLNDFDFTVEFGSHWFLKCKIDYPYWDDLGLEGIPTFNTDVYGLIVTVAESMIPFLRRDQKTINTFKTNCLIRDPFLVTIELYEESIIHEIRGLEKKLSDHLFTLLENEYMKSEDLESAEVQFAILIEKTILHFKSLKDLSPSEGNRLKGLLNSVAIFSKCIEMLQREIAKSRALRNSIFFYRDTLIVKTMFDKSLPLQKKVESYKKMASLLNLSSAESVKLELTDLLNELKVIDQEENSTLCIEQAK